jgi:hypothetical protein
MSRPIRAALLAGVLVLAAAGCGKTVIDSQKAEDFIKSGIEQHTGATVTSVSCPGDVEVVADRTFDCTATSSTGKTATITMKILNDNADVKVISFKPGG